MTRLLAPVAAVAALVAVAIVSASSGRENPYRLRIELPNASGLRDGSRVAVAGVDAGSVTLHVSGRNRVVAELKIDAGKGPVGKNANAQITALNLLGQKRINLDKGDTTNPAPSGSTVAASRVSVTTDLDQIVSVLDGPTRTRLGLLINQTGLALYGRRMDLRTLAEELAPVLTRTTGVFNDLTTDNQALARLITSSDRFVSTMTRERRSLAALVRDAGDAGDVLADHRAELAQTLERAPATLAQAQRFLAELEATAGPLGPAARELQATAPELQRTLDELDPVRIAATPALRTATRVAPSLTRLGRQATPTLRRAVPVVGRLNHFTSSAAPVLTAADGSVDNLVGTLENWARAIQFRDGLSHVFRGEASFTPDTVLGLLDRLKAAQRTKRKPTRRRQPPAAKAAPANQPEKPALPPTIAQILEDVAPGVGALLDQLPKKLDKTGKNLGEAIVGKGSGERQDPSADQQRGLLDFLLGP